MKIDIKKANFLLKIIGGVLIIILISRNCILNNQNKLIPIKLNEYSELLNNPKILKITKIKSLGDNFVELSNDDSSIVIESEKIKKIDEKKLLNINVKYIKQMDGACLISISEDATGNVLLASEITKKDDGYYCEKVYLSGSTHPLLKAYLNFINRIKWI